jgi:hypothetical protein
MPVPVSRTRKKTKKKNQHMPSSKESLRKIRRWGYQVKITKDGNVHNFVPPALSVGTGQTARSAAADIKKDFESLEQFNGCTIEVDPIGYETVSIQILNQIEGLRDQSDLLSQALTDAVTELVKLEPVPEELKGKEFTAEDIKKEVAQRMTNIVMAVRERVKRERMIAAGIDPDTVVASPVEQIPAEFSTIPVTVESAEPAPVSNDPFPDGEFGKEVAA